MVTEFTRFDPAENLTNEERVMLYLEEAQAEAGDDPAFMATVLADIARARNMSALAKETGLTRAGLYKALSPDGNPRMDTIYKVAKALGLRVTFEPIKENTPA